MDRDNRAAQAVVGGIIMFLGAVVTALMAFAPRPTAAFLMGDEPKVSNYAQIDLVANFAVFGGIFLLVTGFIVLICSMKPHDNSTAVGYHQ